MHFVGLDLAWGENKPTGLAVLDDAGVLVRVSAHDSDASIVDALEPYAHDGCLVAIDSIVADVVQANVNELFVPGPPDDAFVERSGEHPREQGQNIELHRSSSPSGGVITILPPFRSTLLMTEATAGIRCSRSLPFTT